MRAPVVRLRKEEQLDEYWYITGNDDDGYRVVNQNETKVLATADRNGLATLQRILHAHNVSVFRKRGAA